MTTGLTQHATAESAATRAGRRLVVVCYAMILAIVVIDGTTWDGVVVGIVLSVPIVLLSLVGRPRPVLVGTLVSLIGFTLAAVLGQGPNSPRSIWIPNRILAVFGIAASGAVALMLQRHRRTADEALRAALSARDTNRLLMSLMAHDLRAPLVAATQALEYVERSSASGNPVDAALVSDTRLRLRRNLRVIEQVLEVARRDLQQESDAPHPLRVRVHLTHEIEREAASFTGEAAASGKRIVVRANGVAGVEVGVDALVLRQVLAILLDNAIRYASPGPVWIDADLTSGNVMVAVTDSGPGLSARPATSGEVGRSGIGLELCRTLAARAGGSLDLEQDSQHGTRFSLRLPMMVPTPRRTFNALAVGRPRRETASLLTG